MSFRNRTYVEAVLIVVFAHGGLLAARNIPLYTIVAAPPIAALLAQWLAAAPQFETAAWFRKAAGKFNQVAASMTETDAIGRWHAVSALGVALLAALIFAPHPPKKFRPEFDPTYFPASAVTKISREVLGREAQAHIFTYDQWGDYLIYRLYPKTRVFIDGRSDFYGDDFETKCVDALNVKYGWEKTLSRFGVDTVLLPPGTPLTGALKLSNDWRVIYDDGIAVVFRAKNVRAANPQAASIAEAADSQVSTTPAMGRGISRDRGVTKTGTGDREIASPKSTI
jgi:hypothetical protein